jgi:hypothetical protein
MTLLSDLFTLNSSSLDTRISKSLFDMTTAVIHGSPLMLTAMGRKSGALNSGIEKHSIKRSDRLLGNKKLQKKRKCFYRTISSFFATITNPLIHVDWSTYYNYNFLILRASISVSGRAVTIYEEVHPEEKQNNDLVHRSFLENLKSVLPPKTTPIICTDAGYKVPWFKAVESHEWYYLARSRGEVYCQLVAEDEWKKTHTYHQQATGKATELPNILLSKTHEHACRAVLFKGEDMQRKKKNRKGKTTLDSTNIKHSKSAKEPWFLVSNLPADKFKAFHFVNLYKRRMGIEEGFRDCKNEYYGMGLKRSRSRCKERLQIILLIAMLALFYLITLGKAAEMKGFQLNFQANTIKHKRVLSYTYLGRRVMQNARYQLSEDQLICAFIELIEETKYA